VRVLVLVHLGVVRVRLRQRAHLLPVAMVAHRQEYPGWDRAKQASFARRVKGAV
jgi:hypothetical protein